MTNLKNYTDLALEALEEGYCVLTSTQRLASHLEGRWLKFKSLSQADSIPGSASVNQAPPVYALSHWVTQFWSQVIFDMDSPPLLLSALQSTQKFENIIRQSTEGKALLQIQKTAQEVYSAYGLCQSWLVSPSELDTQSQNIQAFVNWCAIFDDWCNRRGYLDPSKQLSFLQAHLKLNPSWLVNFPKKLYWVGFDDFPPNLAAFMRFLQDPDNGLGVELRCENILPSPEQVQVVPFARSQDEWQAMANFAKSCLDKEASERRLMQDNLFYQTRIALVVPELTQHRAVIESIFMNTFHPERSFHPAAVDPRHRLFNISRGLPLLDYALIKTAFVILKLSAHFLTVDKIQELLLSPFIIGAEAELCARSQVLQQILELRQSKISVMTLLSLVEHSCPVLFGALTSLVSKLDSIRGESGSARFALINTWRWQFCEWLSLMGWPGERNLSSIEYQTIMRWQTILEEFASLELVEESPVSVLVAISSLEEIARACIFQPQSKAVPVQVLGVLEASGQCFDHIWLSNVTSDTWPAPAKPNPYLPVDLQKRLFMPHASSERELLFSEAILKRLSTSTQDFIVSYAMMEQGRDLEPSPLIVHHIQSSVEIGSDKMGTDKLSLDNLLSLRGRKLDGLEEGNPKFIDIYQRSVEEQGTILSSIEKFAPAVNTEEESRGGASLLTYQSECPFKAFATVRLGLRETQFAEPGLKAHERGQLVHAALERFWNRVNNLSNLLSLSESELHELITLSAQEAIQAIKTPLSKKDHKVFWSLESSRLVKLLTTWIELEKERPSFEVIAHEKKYVTQIGNLTLKIRLDRIDKLQETGHQAVIDYKTGVVSTSDWFGERLTSPQLPLYATLSPHVKAAVYAELKTVDPKWQGVGEVSFFEGVKAVAQLKIGAALEREQEPLDWDDVVSDWKEKIVVLAQEYMSGYAAVEPHHQKHCRTCALSPVCRFYHEESV